MCDLINENGLWIIVGTVVGFSLSEISNIIRNKRNKSKFKKLLMDEIDLNFYQINEKIKIIEAIITAIKNNRFLSGKSVSFSFITYNNHFATIIDEFSPIERDNIRNIYNLLFKIDEILNDLDANYRDDLDNMKVRLNSLDGINKMYLAILGDLMDSLLNAQKLITHLMEGKPIDIYKRNNE